MGKISDIIRHNKLYAILFIFILGINLLILADRLSPEPGEETAKVVSEEPVQPEEKPLLEDEDVSARQERIEELAQENPLLYLFLGLLNLLIIFLLFIGLILDVYFLIRFFRREPVRIQLAQQGNPLWGIGDVVRVILLFLAFGYMFVILQAFVANLFPILQNENFRMVFNTAMMNVVGISIILYFIIKKYHQRIDAIGLTGRGFTRGVFYGIAGYIALIPILAGIMIATFFVTRWLQYKPPVQPIVQIFIEEKETAILWFSSLFAAIFGPVAEEIFFRGFMYSAIRKGLGIFWAMIITSVIFSFLHTHIVGFLPIMALGLLLAYLYEKTGSLVPSMVVHVIHNVGMVILVFLMRAIGV